MKPGKKIQTQGRKIKVKMSTFLWRIMTNDHWYTLYIFTYNIVFEICHIIGMDGKATKIHFYNFATPGKRLLIVS